MENFIFYAVISTISHHEPEKNPPPSTITHDHTKFSHLDIPFKIIITVSSSFCGKRYIENLTFSVKNVFARKLVILSQKFLKKFLPIKYVLC